MCKVRVRAGGVIGTSATMGSAPASHAWHAPLSLSSTALASICEMTSILYALAWDAACAKSKCYTCLCLKPHLLTGLSDCPVYCRLQVLLQDDRPEELMPTICTFAQYMLEIHDLSNRFLLRCASRMNRTLPKSMSISCASPANNTK